jgi:hypothetical protein
LSWTVHGLFSLKDRVLLHNDMAKGVQANQISTNLIQQPGSDHINSELVCKTVRRLKIYVRDHK